MDWWRRPLGALVSGRRVIVVGGPAAAWTSHVAALRDLGATDVLVVATESLGAGPQPQATVAVVDVPGDDTDAMVRLHAVLDILAAPPPAIVDAVEAFDPDGTAVVFGTFLTETPELVGRPLVAHRRPEWVALEDKTIVDALLDRAGVTRASSTVVPVGDASEVWRALDRGNGTVWAADARDGYHGGAARTRWVTDDDEAAAATADLSPWCDTVRVMPFLEGIATSVHGIVLPDGVVALRPVELVTLRRGHELRYSGCATFWDPPAAVREEMRDAARRVGALLQREFDFRGAFTLDGVAMTDGFRPTELNPRFGAGLGMIASGLDGLPLRWCSTSSSAAPSSSCRRQSWRSCCSPGPTPPAAAGLGSCTSTHRSRWPVALPTSRTAPGGGPSPMSAATATSSPRTTTPASRSRPPTPLSDRASVRGPWRSGASPTPNWAPRSER